MARWNAPNPNTPHTTEDSTVTAHLSPSSKSTNLEENLQVIPLSAHIRWEKREEERKEGNSTYYETSE